MPRRNFAPCHEPQLDTWSSNLEYHTHKLLQLLAASIMNHLGRFKEGTSKNIAMERRNHVLYIFEQQKKCVLEVTIIGQELQMIPFNWEATTFDHFNTQRLTNIMGLPYRQSFFPLQCCAKSLQILLQLKLTLCFLTVAVLDSRNPVLTSRNPSQR